MKLFSFVLLAAVLAVTCVQCEIRGVPPSKAGLYRDPFVCIDGSNTIPLSRVNDDYCDCRDGSDEPGTSACVHGRFYCANRGYKGEIIPSSRVNDGFCDCCDGTDEWEGRVQCKNICDEVGRQWREDQESAKRSMQAGMQIRSQYSADGQAAKTTWASELATKKTEQEAKKAIVAERKAKVDELEPREKEERDALRASLETERALQDELAAASAPPPQETPAATDAPAAENGATEEIVEPSAEDRAKEAQREIDRKVGEHKNTVNADPSIWETIRSYISSWFPSEAEAARQELAAAQRELTAVDDTVRELEKNLALDFGADMEFYPLHKKCFSLNTREYTYEVCPFDKAAQKSISGGSHTNLGNWEGWGPNYSQMKFTNGVRCWGGPDRSLTVEVICGAENTLTNIDEPNKCVYTATLSTPAACKPQATSASQDVHDEL